MRRRDFIKAIPGVAAGWPIASRAQQTGLPVVGFLSPQSPGPTMTTRIGGFLAGLSELNYADGRSVGISYAWAEGHYDRLPALANDMVRHQVAVIAAVTQDAALAAKAATTTIPIVFNAGGDPIKFGLVASMNRPGGNVTGVSMFSYQLDAKRLGLLHEMVPRVAAVGVLINPANANADSQERQLQETARSLGLQLYIRRMGSDGDLAAACEGRARDGARALIAGADPFFSNQREMLVVLAAKLGLPAVWEWPDFVEDGGLMSYGTSIVDNYRLVGVYTGRILKGEAPADLPVVQPTKLAMALNLKTARTLGIDVPPALLARADDVFE